MDYEKKYKEAFERAKRINDGDGVECPPGWTTCEVIFPELKAIEDANIRGAIIDYLKDNNLTEWAAWLEKAVTPTPQDWNDYKDKPVEVWNAYVKGLANGVERGKEAVKNSPQYYGLAKQGEPKSTWKPTKEQYGALDYAFNCCPDTELGNYFEGVLSTLIEDLHKLENQSEQKPDKVEPRFHEGDWVVYNNDICQIVKRDEGCNKLVTVFGIEKELVNERNLSTARLWTINDAKDGDVLAYKDEISLYKHDIKNCTKQETTFGGFVYHCCYDGKRFIMDSLYSLTEQDKMDIHPATKEQRDILFQKMHEVGYEWDADRKELCPLSKSEATSDSVTQTLVDTAKAFLQALSSTPYNNTPVVEAQFAVKQLLTFLSDPKAYDPDASNEHKSAEWSEENEQLIDEVAVCLRKYEEQVQGGYSKFYVQSLADRIESLIPGNTCKATGWSEEDEKQARQIERIVHYDGCSKKLQKQISDWLKSIKNRIQPKQEWSEEDEAMFQGVIETEQYMLDVVYGRKIFAVGNEDLKEECTKELAWLNSLRPKKQWKPSEEQLRELENVFSPDTDSWDEGVLRKLYEQLKQL